ncbi:MAG: hypothetical protein KY455_01470 [Euryarchaeota archaeon]|nr:hypothetical protein [Euryarchaeota archaeon]
MKIARVSTVPPSSLFGLLTVATAFLYDIRFFGEAGFLDILPDVVGYTLFLVAGLRLRHHEGSVAHRVVWSTALLVPLGLFELAFGLLAGHFGLTSGGWQLGFFLAGTAAAILEVVLVWSLAGYVADLARQNAAFGLIGRAVLRRNLFIAYVVVAWLMPPPQVFRLGETIVLVLGAFAVALLALLFDETRKRLSAAEPPPAERGR